MYVRSLLAQAGIAHSEGNPGEDYKAIDVTAHLSRGVVTAQVKTRISPRLSKDSTYYSISVTEEWSEKWKGQVLPIYLVLVALAKREYCHMVGHGQKFTTWHAHAYWTQVNDTKRGIVRVPVQNRLTMDTFVQWEHDILDAFTKGVT
jgi:hypothetical protein